MNASLFFPSFSSQSGPATHLLVLTPESTQAGVQTPVEVIALDASNHRVFNYTGTVHFTSSDTSATLPADYTFTAHDRGVHFFSATFQATGTDSLTATDTTTSSVTGDVSVNVDPAPVATHFLVLTPRDVVTGQATPVLVVALDASNHIVPNYTGTVQLTTTDANATVPANYTFQASDHGRHVFQVTFATTGSQTLTATDTGTSSLTGTDMVTVNPAPVATHFAVVVQRHVVAGQPASVLVVALDASNHVVPNYTGTVQLTSSDTGATLPASYTFQASDHGRHLFQVTFATTGSQTVTATDAADSTLTGDATAVVRQSGSGFGGYSYFQGFGGLGQAQLDSLFASFAGRGGLGGFR